MSALIRESHANETQALFLSANGSQIITGNLDVTGNLTVDGTATLKNIVETNDIVNMYAGTAAPTPSLQLVPTAGPAGMEIRTDGVIGFGVLNLATPPQTTLDTSGTPNGDVLTVGGALIANTLAGIGPAPVSLITATQNITPAPVSPAPAVGFPVQVNVPTQAGWEFDVMARGIITLASGVADPDDIVNVQLDAGTTTPAVWTYQFKPSSVGNNGLWAIRDRVVSDATTTTVFIAVQTLRAGASTADYNVSLVQLDATRVK
jgi:hypothetical protein